MDTNKNVVKVEGAYRGWVEVGKRREMGDIHNTVKNEK